MTHQAIPLLRRVTVSELTRTIRPPVDNETLEAASKIVERVRAEGTQAIREYAERFGERSLGELLVLGKPEMDAARLALPEKDRAVLERTADRIRTFAQAQRDAIRPVDVPIPGGLDGLGGRVGHTVEPIQKRWVLRPGGPVPAPVLCAHDCGDRARGRVRTGRRGVAWRASACARGRVGRGRRRVSRDRRRARDRRDGVRLRWAGSV